MVARRHGEQLSGRHVPISETMPVLRHARPSRGLPWVYYLVCLAFQATLTTPSTADDFAGEVINVIDGDTLTVVHDGVEDTVRLNGIDCPEKNQLYGKDAKTFTRSRVLHKVVTIEVKDVDRDGRLIADVVLPDGTMLNHELIKEGFAWWFFRYSTDATLKALETEARDAKKGLWADPIPIPPWVFRKIQRKQVPDMSDFQYPGTIPSSLLANKRSHVYRDSSCKGYGAMLEGKNVMKFETAAEAEAAGYHRASNCPRDRQQE